MPPLALRPIMARRIVLGFRRPAPPGACLLPGARHNSAPAWMAEQKRRFEEEQRRRQRRKQVAEDDEAADQKNNARMEEELATLEPLSTALPVTEADGWYVYDDHDAFPGVEVERWDPSTEETGGGFRKLEEAKYHCEKMGYGGFVQRWHCFFHFRAASPRALTLRRQPCKKDDEGMHVLYVRPQMDGTPALDEATAKALEEAKARGEEPQRKEFEPPEPPSPFEDEEFDFKDGQWNPDDLPPDAQGAAEGASASTPAPAAAAAVEPVQEEEDEVLAGGLRRGDRVTTKADVCVGGRVAVLQGGSGTVEGPAPRSPTERVRVRFDARQDGSEKGINVLPREVTRVQ
eukprot:TRINITY_DN30691_c0_g1_i1.p2 TRINITY_DN30691_c0_g1~~TRINITY_DN30691_c0_g1_i1.p2  ORF type:complete len:365 (+),score=163.33 TRINITY_DN30691_c0_g1_i1:59-1096(+)